MKVTLVFPGQGAQYVGMNHKIQETKYAHYFERANQALGFNLLEIMSKGPEDKLKLTAFTQPAIVAHSMALFEKLKTEYPLHIERVLGHSVGEYSALCAAGVIDFEDTIRAVHIRGQAMQQATPVGVGKMIAVLKIGEDWVLKACREASTTEEQVMPANFNDPRQIVISGHADACDRAIEWLTANCPERFGSIPLQVSAPFHSALMQPAANVMKEHLQKISFSKLALPYVANIDAKEYGIESDSEEIKNRLVDQVCGSVKWTQSIQNLPVDTKYIEVGPSKVLAGLIKRIQPAAKVISLDTLEDWGQLKEFLA